MSFKVTIGAEQGEPFKIRPHFVDELFPSISVWAAVRYVASVFMMEMERRQAAVIPALLTLVPELGLECC
jgi:hypothetical protein